MLTVVVGVEFPAALQVNGKRIVSLYEVFFTQTHEQLWDPKKKMKEKWSGTQVDLVRCIASVGGALCRLGTVDQADAAKLWDKRANLLHWTLRKSLSPRLVSLQLLTLFSLPCSAQPDGTPLSSGSGSLPKTQRRRSIKFRRRLLRK